MVARDARRLFDLGLGLFALVLIAGCAAKSPPEPVVSPTGIVYPLGTPPTETRESQTAELYLRQDRTDRALELALEGIAADSANPIHFFLGGVAHARLGDLRAADVLFDEAERIYPAYELDTEPEREAAWGAAFNRGLEIYQRGDAEGAIDTWSGAIELYGIRPEAHRNLASVLAVEGRYDEAIDVYQEGIAGLGERPVTRVLTEEEVEARLEAAYDLEAELATLLLLRSRFSEAEPLLRRRLERAPESVRVRSDLATALTGLGRDIEAAELYADLLSAEGLQATQLFNLGVGLFRADEFDEAATAFRRLAELRPNSRDAWFNYANTLFAAEAWSDLARISAELEYVDPLGENGRLIVARAHLEVGDEAAARTALQAVDAAPITLAGLRLRRSSTSATVDGEVSGNAAEPGTSIPLTFVFYDDEGDEAGREELLLEAPAQDEVRPFSVETDFRAAAYRYELSR